MPHATSQEFEAGNWNVTLLRYLLPVHNNNRLIIVVPSYHIVVIRHLTVRTANAGRNRAKDPTPNRLSLYSFQKEIPLSSQETARDGIRTRPNVNRINFFVVSVHRTTSRGSLCLEEKKVGKERGNDSWNWNGYVSSEKNYRYCDKYYCCFFSGEHRWNVSATTSRDYFDAKITLHDGHSISQCCDHGIIPPDAINYQSCNPGGRLYITTITITTNNNPQPNQLLSTPSHPIGKKTTTVGGDFSR